MALLLGLAAIACMQVACKGPANQGAKDSPPQNNAVKEDPKAAAPAGVEVTRAPPPVPDGALDVAPLLRADDINKALQTRIEFQQAQLQGIRPSSNYGSARLRPTNKGDNYGVALQVWRSQNKDAASKRLTNFARTQKDARTTGEIGHRSVRSKRRRILHINWIIPQSWEVVTLTCDDRLCDDASILALAHRVDVRLADLARP